MGDGRRLEAVVRISSKKTRNRRTSRAVPYREEKNGVAYSEEKYMNSCALISIIVWLLGALAYRINERWVLLKKTSRWHRLPRSERVFLCLLWPVALKKES